MMNPEGQVLGVADGIQQRFQVQREGGAPFVRIVMPIPSDGYPTGAPVPYRPGEPDRDEELTWAWELAVSAQGRDISLTRTYRLEIGPAAPTIR